MTSDYTAYGLTFSSELTLPELSVPSHKSSKADVAIRFGDVSKDGIPGGKQISPYIWTGPECIWLEVPQIARFLVSTGRKILITPMPSIDEASLRVFLLGSALGALLFQRGFLVLHGNAIEIGDKCLICVGPSGIGKSTLTAAFIQRGYRVLADDVVPITKDGLVIPGFPRIKLWKDVAEKLSIATQGLDRILPELEKFNLPLAERFCDSPRKVGKIYLLSHHEADTVEITPIKGMDKFSVLRANTYRRGFMAGMSLQSAHLRQCSALAGAVAIASLQRPKQGFKIDAIVDALLAEMHEAG